MKKRPVIGITTYGRDQMGHFHLPGEYLDSVRRAGGLPLLLTPGETHLEELFEMVDGLIFAGGGDFDPRVYGGQSHPSIERVDPERDAFELRLAEVALAGAKPTLGICRGIQLLNIATGGDLIAHLPETVGNQVSHMGENSSSCEHEVTLVGSSRLCAVFGAARAPVQSKHHQGLAKIAPVWSQVARADDGIIEGLEHKQHPWMVAVLWHPELAQEDPRQQRLFAEFVAAAGEAA